MAAGGAGEGFREPRGDAVRSAVDNARLAGVALDPATLRILDDFGAGLIDADEMVRRGLALWGPGADRPAGRS